MRKSIQKRRAAVNLQGVNTMRWNVILHADVCIELQYFLEFWGGSHSSAKEQMLHEVSPGNSLWSYLGFEFTDYNAETCIEEMLQDASKTI